LIGLSEFVQNWWWAVLIAVAITVVSVSKILAQEGPRRSFHGFLLQTPIIGRVIRGVNTARFTRTMAILSQSGVPIIESLRICAAVVTNLPMRDAINEAGVRVREGAAIGRSLAQSKLFPPMTMHLISSGESSGELDNMLDRAATHQESEMDSLLGPDYYHGCHGLADRAGDPAADIRDQSARLTPIRPNCVGNHILVN
jgi:general secretion pathway protein F